MPRLTRCLVPFALAAAVAAGACTRSDRSAATAADSTGRNLQMANVDSASQPQLNDVPPAPESTVAPTPAPAAAPATPAPAPARERRRAPDRRPAASQPAPVAQQPAQPAEPTTTASGNNVAVTPNGRARTLGQIATGSVINLTSDDTVCTGSNKAGDKFTGTVTDAVVGSDGAVIPAGSKVALEVTDLKHSGTATQSIEMTFAVLSVSVSGKAYPLSADIDHVDVNQVRHMSAKSTAAKVAGGAAVGAIIGQIIGHNTKGTVIGAATGAAAGTGVALGTAAYEGCVPVGGKISMHLTSPATIAAQ